MRALSITGSASSPPLASLRTRSTNSRARSSPRSMSISSVKSAEQRLRQVVRAEAAGPPAEILDHRPQIAQAGLGHRSPRRPHRQRAGHWETRSDGRLAGRQAGLRSLSGACRQGRPSSFKAGSRLGTLTPAEAVTSICRGPGISPNKRRSAALPACAARPRQDPGPAGP